MNSWKAILAVCLIFFGGALTGAFVATKVRNSTTRREIPGQTSSLGPQARLEVIRRFALRTDLSPEQRARIDRIIDEAGARMKSRMDEIRPAMRSELVKAIQAVAAELKPPQQVLFEEKLKSRFPQLAEKTSPEAGAKPGNQPHKAAP